MSEQTNKKGSKQPQEQVSTDSPLNATHVLRHNSKYHERLQKLHSVTFEQSKALTAGEVREHFKVILMNENLLEAVKSQGTGYGSDYDKHHATLLKSLRTFTDFDFSVLTKPELFKFMALISRYRPVQPFSFLMDCSKISDKLNGK